MAHSSKQAITGCLWFYITPRTDPPCLLFMFLFSCHHFFRERRSQGFRNACDQCLSSPRLWLWARRPYHIAKRLLYCVWYLTELPLCLCLSESLSRPLCQLSITLHKAACDCKRYGFVSERHEGKLEVAVGRRNKPQWSWSRISSYVCIEEEETMHFN